MSEVAEFYDEFSNRQSSVGINNRHLSIIHHFEKTGIKNDAHILEVGCGIGTVSELLLRFLSANGSLHSVDISPVSIQIANKLSAKYKNAFFEVRDVTQEALSKQFDTIILPDVIEHIPFELYKQFFSNLFQMLTSKGFIFIHIPHPNYQEWLLKSKSKDLQIIDQAVYTDQLLGVIYPIGFYLDNLKSYSVYSCEDDYQVLILKKKSTSRNYELQGSYFQLPFMERLTKKIRHTFRGFK